MAREDYNQYKKLLLKLHEMNAQGTDQTPEADAIRDEMDGPGDRLSPLERERVGGLSADLYMLTGEEVKEKTDRPWELQGFLDNYHEKNWDRVLEILRMSTLQMDEHWVAFSRMVCWDAIGDQDVALLFAEYALKLTPTDSRFREFVDIYRRESGHNFNVSLAAAMSNPLSQQVEQELFHELSLAQTA